MDIYEFCFLFSLEKFHSFEEDTEKVEIWGGYQYNSCVKIISRNKLGRPFPSILFSSKGCTILNTAWGTRLTPPPQRPLPSIACPNFTRNPAALGPIQSLFVFRVGPS